MKVQNNTGIKMKRTITQNKQLYGLFAKLGIDEATKEEMVLSITKGRTHHTSEMTETEAYKLLSRLTNDVLKHKSTNRKFNEINQQLRRNIFKLFYDCGLIHAGMNTIEKVEFIDNWIINKLNLDKKLNYLTFEELTKFVTQMRAIRRNYIERSAKNASLN